MVESLKAESGRRKIKVLILEDSDSRRRVFRENLSEDCSLHFFDTVRDAKRAIETQGPFDLIYLDHDLDQRIFVDSEEENTGYQLAKYIAEKKLGARIILHTMNPYGAARMKELLPQASHIEFPELFP